MAMWVDTAGERTRVRVVGVLNVDNRRELERHVLDACARGTPDVVLDVADVPRMDTAALAMLLLLVERVRVLGGQFRLVHLTAEIRSLVARTQTAGLLGLDPESPGAD